MSYYYRMDGLGKISRCGSKQAAVEKASSRVRLSNLPAPYAEVFRGVVLENAKVIRRIWKDAEGMQFMDY